MQFKSHIVILSCTVSFSISHNALNFAEESVIRFDQLRNARYHHLPKSMMISEESMSENEDLMVVPLTWPSKMVNTFFRKVDEKSMEKKSSQAK